MSHPAASIRRPILAAAAIERLEDRVLCSRTLPDASSVTLTRFDNVNAPIVNNKPTWIIVHGLLSSKDAAGIKILATAVDAASSKDQVLMVDWRKLAIVSDIGRVTQDNAQATANAVAAKIEAAGIPASRINLIGFSMGGLVVDRLAKDLHARGGVNSIIALDPSSPQIVDGKGIQRRADMNSAVDSKYSIAFYGSDIGSPIERALTADDTIRVDHIGDSAVDRHAGVFDVFTNMTKINNTAHPDAASQIFSLTHIMNHDMPAWKKDAYAPLKGLGGFEGIITAKGAPGTLRPRRFVFMNSAGRGQLALGS